MAQTSVRNHAQRGNHQQYARMTLPNPQKHVIPTAVLTKSKLVPITVARPVTVAIPKPLMTRLRQAKTVVTKPHSPPRRNLNRSPSLKASTFPPKVIAAQTPMVNAVKGNWLNGGYVAFDSNPKGGKISGKGKIRTGKLDFDDVYFVKELKFNLFSVSQMCDKKNIILFTNTECLVLSLEFKLPDESQVLLRVHKENNMYNVDLKNIVPSGDLTCLFTKATLDESNLWHRKLGHINFKTMNKLIKCNLVRGLPTKVFENDHTCVACKKGKQHRASCKTKPVNSVNQPLQRLHMDLFGPTFVKCLNKKSYFISTTYSTTIPNCLITITSTTTPIFTRCRNFNGPSPHSTRNMVKKLERRNKLKVSKLKRLKRIGTAQRVDRSDDTVMDDVSKQGRIIADMDADVDVTLKDVADIAKEVTADAEIEESAYVQGRQAQIYQIDLEHADKVMSMQDDKVEPAELQEVVEVVTTTKLITEVVTTTMLLEGEKRVVIRDPEETATPSTIIHFEAKSKDKEKWILVKEPKPLKKQAQIEQVEAFARELEAELDKTINWDDVIDQVQRKEKEDNVVMRYQALKRKPQTEAQARKNMMIYLRNMAGFKMDYFKGMTYDDIRPIFKKKFNSNVALLQKTKEQMEEKDIRALKRTSKSQADKAAKKQKLDKKVAELKRHLQIVPNNDDDVYTEAIPLARKVPVVDYEIYTENNKPYYKIIRADGSL
nr:putative ribonuclease H-like domain-containing protein [Tanacetum cinerariifolium]